MDGIAIRAYVAVNQKVNKKTETPTCSHLSVKFSLKTFEFCTRLK